MRDIRRSSGASPPFWLPHDHHQGTATSSNACGCGRSSPGSTLREAAGPGVTMLELDRMAARIIAEGDCTPNFLNYHGFPAHVCLSPNEGHRPRHTRRRASQRATSSRWTPGPSTRGGTLMLRSPLRWAKSPPEVQALLDTTERAMWVGIEASSRGPSVTSGQPSRPWGSGRLGVVREYVGHGIGRQMHEEPQVLNYGEPGRA